MTIILNHINRENERLTTPEILPSCSKQRQNDSIIVSDPNERQRFLPENFNEKATQSQRKKESDLSSQTQNTARTGPPAPSTIFPAVLGSDPPVDERFSAWA